MTTQAVTHVNAHKVRRDELRAQAIALNGEADQLDLVIASIEGVKEPAQEPVGQVEEAPEPEVRDEPVHIDIEDKSTTEKVKVKAK